MITDQSTVVCRDSEVELRIVAVPGNVFYPTRPGVDAGVRHDAPAVLPASAVQKQSDVQVVLLRARQSFVETADLEEAGPSVQRSFDVDVVFDEMGQRLFARPIPVRGRGNHTFETMVAELKVSKYGIHAVLEGVEPSLHGVREEDVVGIEKLDELSARYRESTISRCRSARLTLPNAVNSVSEAGNNVIAAIRRAVVDNDDFHVLTGLRERTFDRFADEGFAVVAGDDDRSSARRERACTRREIGTRPAEGLSAAMIW
jgi:hypothetical protein